MNLFFDFISSVTNLNSYRHLAQKPVKKSLGYFLLWHFILSLSVCVYLFYHFLNPFRESLQSLHDSLSSPELSTFSLSVNQEDVLLSNEYDIVIHNPNPNQIFDLPNLISITQDSTASTLTSVFHVSPQSLTARLAPSQEPIIFPWALLGENTTITPSHIQSEVTKLIHSLSGVPILPFSVVTFVLWLNLLFINSLLILSYLVLFYLLGLFLPLPLPLNQLASLSLHTNVLAQTLTLIVIALYSTAPAGFTSWAFIAITSLALFNLRLKKPKHIV